MASITSWTRLEPHTRSDDLSAGLEARVHDPLWFLARQWQLGELTGEDGGTPLSASIAVQEVPLSGVTAGAPLAAMVEREGASPHYDVRASVEAGLTLGRLLTAA